MLTQERLKELFDYNSETGWFTNRFTRGVAAKGQRAGCPSGHGYRKIGVDYCKCYEHHLAWLYIYGEWPGEIDHKDGDGSNNAIENLRPATRSQNNFNSDRLTGASGLRGAYWDSKSSSWYSKIQVDGQVHHLGMFRTAEEAHVAYRAAADRMAGEFARHNRESHQPVLGA